MDYRLFGIAIQTGNKLTTIIDKQTNQINKMTKQEKYLDSLTGAVILNQLALNFNEDLKYTKFYKHELKKSLNHDY